VQPYGVRFGADGWLLVPVRDASGKLWNVQRIAPAKPASGADKLFLKGGRKSGLWHWCGDPAGAAVLLIAEGYATAASLHQATGRPVAVAFDAGNLAHVAKALHSSFPAVLLVLCGDDDLQTFAEKGFNPGRDKATAAALAVHGLAVFPEGLPEGGSDFNDMHQAVGFDAVRLTVDSVVDSFDPHQGKPQATKPTPAGKRGQSAGRERTGPQNEPGSGKVFDRFFVLEGDGVYFIPPGDDVGAPRKVCGVLRVVGLARDAHDNQAALLLEFLTQFGKVRRWLDAAFYAGGRWQRLPHGATQSGLYDPHQKRAAPMVDRVFAKPSA
jgi:putative DNA primase/helicase